jgi:hypothetical protein
MSQSYLDHAHRMLTAAMIAQVTSDNQPLPNSYQFPDDEIGPLKQLPLTGCHVDHKERQLVITMAEAEQANSAEHERLLRQVLGDISYQINYTTHRDHAAPAKDKAARPLWGGVEMDSPSAIGTLTLVVRKSGVDYTLVSAHVVGVGNTGQVVGQPDTTTGKYGTVTLNPKGPDRASDSALASIDQNKITGQVDCIWRAADAYFEVTDKAKTSDLTVGTKVYMQGASSTDLGEGRITATNVTSKRPSGLVLTGQIAASYPAIPGDSGGPVFLAGARQAEVTFAGIEVGSHGDGELFSPWEGIKSDLDL